VLVGLVVLVHAGSLDSGFHFDDEHSVVGNPYLRSLANLPAFFTDPAMFSRNPGSAMYRPVLLVTYALNYRFGGYDRIGFHLVNLAVHAGASLLVRAVLLRVGASPAGALVSALVFGLHPLVLEPVNYVSSRSESLAALLLLASLLLYLRSGWVSLAGSLLAFSAGLLTKSTVAVLPAVLLLWEGTVGERRPVTAVRRQGPYWLVLAVYLVATGTLLREALVEAPVRAWTAQLCTQAKALVYYAKLLCLPWPLTVEHQFFVSSSSREPVVWLAVALLGSLLVVLATRSHPWRGPFWFWLGWIGLCLLPTLVVPLNVLVAERRLYLPLVGVVGLLAVVLGQGPLPRRRWVLAGTAVLLLAGRTAQGSQAWESEERLWREAAKQAPLMTRPHLRLGILYRQQGRLDQAEAEFAQVLALDSTSAPAWNDLGNLQVQRGEVGLAEHSYQRALALLPSYAEALANLASLRAGQGRTEEALDLYARSLAISPLRGEVHHNLGTLHLRAGRYSEALTALERAAALNPEAAGVQFNLGGALEGLDRLPEAEAAYQRALSLDPGYVRAWYNLGFLYERMSRTADAMTAFDAFLRQWQGEPRFSDEARRRRQALAGGTRH
jgi:Flp pilus assembly protein TadD